jgi:hypothetical protein
MSWKTMLMLAVLATMVGVGNIPLPVVALVGLAGLLVHIADKKGLFNRKRGRGFSSPPPLFLPALKGEIKEVRRLLNEGADPNAPAGDGETPLMVAAGFGHLRVARMLVDSGANPRAKDKMGRTALGWAMTDVEEAHPEFAEFVARNGVKEKDKITEYFFSIGVEPSDHDGL